MNPVARLPLLVALGLAVVAASGCEVLTQRLTRNQPPRVLSATPTLDDVVRVVNDNSSRVRSLVAPDASLQVPLQPSLRASIAVDRPRRLRVRAETSLTGPELDVGSNDQLFWVWVRRAQPPALYYGTHDRLLDSQARQLLPVQPEWLVEALGLATFDTTGQHTGPNPLRGGKQLEIRTIRQSPSGPQTKLTVVDAASGYVLEQHLYDAAGGLVASALTSRHQADAASGAVLPRKIEIRWPATQFTLNVELRTVQVNVPTSNNLTLYEMPSYPNAQPIDVTAPIAPPPGTAYPVSTAPPPLAERPVLLR